MSDRVKSTTVFVGGISWKADETSLKEFFSSYGNVVDCKIIVDRETNKSKGYGFVTFEDLETAEKVKKVTDLNFLGKVMNVGNAYRKNTPKPNANPNNTQQVSYPGYPMQWQYAPVYPGMNPYPYVPYGYEQVPFYPGHAYYSPEHYYSYPYHYPMMPLQPGEEIQPHGEQPHSENDVQHNPSPDQETEVDEATKKLSEVSLH